MIIITFSISFVSAQLVPFCNFQQNFIAFKDTQTQITHSHKSHLHTLSLSLSLSSSSFFPSLVPRNKYPKTLNLHFKFKHSYSERERERENGCGLEASSCRDIDNNHVCDAWEHDQAWPFWFCWSKLLLQPPFFSLSHALSFVDSFSFCVCESCLNNPYCVFFFIICFQFIWICFSLHFKVCYFILLLLFFMGFVCNWDRDHDESAKVTKPIFYYVVSFGISSFFMWKLTELFA